MQWGQVEVKFDRGQVWPKSSLSAVKFGRGQVVADPFYLSIFEERMIPKFINSMPQISFTRF